MALGQTYLAEYGPPTDAVDKSHFFVGAIIVGAFWVAAACGFGVAEHLRDKRRVDAESAQTEQWESYHSEQREDRRQGDLRYAELQSQLIEFAAGALTRRALLHIRNVTVLLEEYFETERSLQDELRIYNMLPVDARAKLREPESIVWDLGVAERKFCVQYGSRGYHRELLEIVEEFAHKGARTPSTETLRRYPRLQVREPYTARNRTDALNALVREYVAKHG